MIPCTSICNSPYCLLRSQKEENIGLLKTELTNKNVIPRFLVVPNPVTILSTILPKYKYFTVLDFYAPFLYCLLDKKSIFDFPFFGLISNMIGQNVSGILEGTSCFSQNLNSDVKGNILKGFNSASFCP